MQVLLSLQQWTDSSIEAHCIEDELFEVDSSSWSSIQSYMNDRGLSLEDLLREMLEVFLVARVSSGGRDTEQSDSLL